MISIAFTHRGAEVTGAFHQVALIQVIRPHTNAHQVLHQLAHDVRAIVDSGQQHRLVAQRDACPGEFIAGISQFRGDLVGVVDMDVQPQRVEFLQHIGQFGGDAHGHEYRYAAADADDLDMWNFTQAGEDLFQLLGCNGERVAAGKQDIPYLRGFLQIIDLGFKFSPREVGTRVADDPGAGAVAAVRGALGGDQHQNPVGVAVNQTRAPGNGGLPPGNLPSYR